MSEHIYRLTRTLKDKVYLRWTAFGIGRRDLSMSVSIEKFHNDWEAVGPRLYRRKPNTGKTLMEIYKDEDKQD